MEYFIWNPDPILFSMGSVSVYWYGVLFASAIISGFSVMNWIYKQEKKPIQQLESLQIYMLLGIVIGARLGHCFFYDPMYYLSNPLEILAIHKGGLASHGGGIGAMLATYLYVRKENVTFLYLLDRLVIATALFAFFVRIGNFMNSEIVGVPTHVSWSIIFSKFDTLPRHPAQLYEAFAYLSIFLLLLFIYQFKREKIKSGFLSGLFLSLVFGARILIEFVKERQSTYTQDMFFTTGQFLSMPFFLLGIILIVFSLKKKK